MPFTLTPLADTGARFADFAPYAPSIDGRGRVAFRAALRGGGSGAFRAGDGPGADLARTGDRVRDVISHPDVADDGSWCAYADLASGAQALVRGRDGEVAVVVDTRVGFTRIGPLGPTMNEAGAFAFRADGPHGPGVFRARGAIIDPVADARRFAAFHGLPAIDGRGRIVFRADLANGAQGLYGDDDGALTRLADTTGELAALGRFPCVAADGTVVVAATRRDGAPGLLRMAAGAPEATFERADAFESVRGALVDDAGSVVLIATREGGSLGVHDAGGREILAIGGVLLGSTVADLALNPVSVNGVGQLAIRVTLADARQIIVRAERG